ELAGLPDHDRPTADDQHARDVAALRHQAPSPLSRPKSSVEPSENWTARGRIWDGSTSMRVQKRSKRYAASCGPAAASGWYCTENAVSRPVSSRSSIPSTTSSLRQTWLTVAGPYGVGVAASRGARTAN